MIDFQRAIAIDQLPHDVRLLKSIVETHRL
jgi:hypothetical protein